MSYELPKSIIFVCDDAAALSPMYAAVFTAFSGGRSIALSAASKELAEIDPLAAKVCADNGVEIKNHRRIEWSKVLGSIQPDLVVAITPAAQHVALEATRNKHNDVEYWPLLYPSANADSETEFVDLLEQIRGRMIERFGVGTSWEDISPLPSLEEEKIESSEAQMDESLSQAEKVSLVQESLENRPVEISAYLNSLIILTEEKIEILESRKPNDPAALKEWQAWMDFLLNLRSTVIKLASCANEAVLESQSTENLAAKTQNVLDVYKSNFLEWPRENVKEVVDGTFRASLVGCCAVVGGLFGQPIAGALIGSAIFGGPKVGKAIGDAIKSGSSTS